MLKFSDRLAPDAATLIETPGVAGVDEVGRGPLAGPVVAAAVVLPIDFDCTGIHDSKQMTRQQRETQSARIMACAEWSIAVVSNEEIDELNIYWASLKAMKMAVDGLGKPPKEAIVDGNKVPPSISCPATCVVKGDSIYASIAAASIIAKVKRDALMAEYSVQYPRYGFHNHFGYSTPEHLRSLKEYGPCAIHRRSFERVREILNQPCLNLD